MTPQLPARRPADADLVPGLAFMLVLLALGLLAMATDPRLLDGWSVWTKPVKFALSLAVHIATLAIFAARLSPPFRQGPTMRVLVPVVLFCILGEMAYILAQAAQQQHSHFNVATPFHAAMYTAMGIGAVILTAGAAVIGLLTWRDRRADLAPGLRTGAILGLVGGTVLTVLVGAAMGGSGSHFVGTPAPDAPVLPLFGWSLAVGDLRPPHFFALHMMQAVPLLGWALDRVAPGRAVAGTTLGALLWAALTLALFAQAQAGIPLFF